MEQPGQAPAPLRRVNQHYYFNFDGSFRITLLRKRNQKAQSFSLVHAFKNGGSGSSWENLQSEPEGKSWVLNAHEGDHIQMWTKEAHGPSHAALSRETGDAPQVVVALFADDAADADFEVHKISP